MKPKEGDLCGKTEKAMSKSYTFGKPPKPSKKNIKSLSAPLTATDTFCRQNLCSDNSMSTILVCNFTKSPQEGASQ